MVCKNDLIPAIGADFIGYLQIEPDLGFLLLGT